jgi:hypothetical protein
VRNFAAQQTKALGSAIERVGITVGRLEEAAEERFDLGASKKSDARLAQFGMQHRAALKQMRGADAKAGYEAWAQAWNDEADKIAESLTNDRQRDLFGEMRMRRWERDNGFAVSHVNDESYTEHVGGIKLRMEVSKQEAAASYGTPEFNSALARALSEAQQFADVSGIEGETEELYMQEQAGEIFSGAIEHALQADDVEQAQEIIEKYGEMMPKAVLKDAQADVSKGAQVQRDKSAADLGLDAASAAREQFPGDVLAQLESLDKRRQSDKGFNSRAYLTAQSEAIRMAGVEDSQRVGKAKSAMEGAKKWAALNRDTVNRDAVITQMPAQLMFDLADSGTLDEFEWYVETGGHYFTTLRGHQLLATADGVDLARRFDSPEQIEHFYRYDLDNKAMAAMQQVWAKGREQIGAAVAKREKATHLSEAERKQAIIKRLQQMKHLPEKFHLDIYTGDPTTDKQVSPFMATRYLQSERVTKFIEAVERRLENEEFVSDTEVKKAVHDEWEFGGLIDDPVTGQKRYLPDSMRFVEGMQLPGWATGNEFEKQQIIVWRLHPERDDYKIVSGEAGSMPDEMIDMTWEERLEYARQNPRHFVVGSPDKFVGGTFPVTGTDDQTGLPFFEKQIPLPDRGAGMIGSIEESGEITEGGITKTLARALMDVRGAQDERERKKVEHWDAQRYRLAGELRAEMLYEMSGVIERDMARAAKAEAAHEAAKAGKGRHSTFLGRALTAVTGGADLGNTDPKSTEEVFKLTADRLWARRGDELEYYGLSREDLDEIMKGDDPVYYTPPEQRSWAQRAEIEGWQLPKLERFGDR